MIKVKTFLILALSICYADGQVEIECGKQQTQGQSLIRYGQNTNSGDWPWHVALYYKPNKDPLYLCGGSLVSQFHVITAAHCVTDVNTIVPRKTDHIVLYLGLHNLKKLTDADVQRHELSNIRVHPDYTVTPYNNDLAVLKVKNYVEFDEYVWPICLWKDLLKDVKNDGVVVGWGFNENNAITDKLMKTNLPIIEFEKCLSSDSEFFSKYKNQKTFCAGYTNGTSICTGDSGGGMYITDKENVWHLRGIVSAAVYIPETMICHASHYVIFTDVAQHLNWIKENIK